MFVQYYEYILLTRIMRQAEVVKPSFGKVMAKWIQAVRRME